MELGIQIPLLSEYLIQKLFLLKFHLMSSNSNKCDGRALLYINFATVFLAISTNVPLHLILSAFATAVL
jgi:hypothetical protein